LDYSQAIFKNFFKIVFFLFSKIGRQQKHVQYKFKTVAPKVYDNLPAKHALIPFAVFKNSGVLKSRKSPPSLLNTGDTLTRLY